MKSQLMQGVRMMPPGSKLVPIFHLPKGKNKLGRWCVAVPESDVAAVRKAFANGTLPDSEIHGAICCLGDDGLEKFFEVSMRDYGNWAAPITFEEPEDAFDLDGSIPFVDLDGSSVNADQPIKGVIFTDAAGRDIEASAPHEAIQTPKKALRYNLSNFLAAKGEILEGGRKYQVTVFDQTYSAHLWHVGPDNKQRIFGAVAYCAVVPKPPKSVIYVEAIAVVPRLIARVCSPFAE